MNRSFRCGPPSPQDRPNKSLHTSSNFLASFLEARIIQNIHSMIWIENSSHTGEGNQSITHVVTASDGVWCGKRFGTRLRKIPTFKSNNLIET
jgi:hypothetical protein